MLMLQGWAPEVGWTSRPPPKGLIVALLPPLATCTVAAAASVTAVNLWPGPTSLRYAHALQAARPIAQTPASPLCLGVSVAVWCISAAHRHAPFPHRTSPTKHKFKDKILRSLKAVMAEH